MLGSLGLSCSSLGALLELYSAAWGSWRFLKAMVGHLGPILGLEQLGALLGLSWNSLGAIFRSHLGPILGLCWAAWLSWGSLGALLGLSWGSLGALSWDYIQQLGALLEACEGYGVPFGNYIGAMPGRPTRTQARDQTQPSAASATPATQNKV